MMGKERKKILFVGAGGQLATVVLPLLAEQYEVVGIGGRRHELKEHCVDFYVGNLLQDYGDLFQKAFEKHTFDAIIWNPVRYFFTPLLGTTRETLHTEFDIGIALPIECVKMLFNSPRVKNKTTFVIVSSGSAFRYSTNLASYGIIKNAQIKLGEILNLELSDKLCCKVIAPGSVPKLDPAILTNAFIQSIEDVGEEPLLYKVF
jgi:NAD(P)-dependent dehydrogenase (short-subunit alcohol dehydrogenase family)